MSKRFEQQVATCRKIAVVTLLVLSMLVGTGCSQAPATRQSVSTAAPTVTSGSTTALETSPASDQVIADAFASQSSGVQVTGEGVVERILSDDNNGSRHQRFVLKLDSEQTLLVAHNIDLAPRITTLQGGDTVAFFGEYEYNAEGGVIHWTHRDPDGSHVAGWLQHEGVVYQ